MIGDLYDQSTFVARRGNSLCCASFTSINYPQLYSLSLVNFHEITLYEYLTGNLIHRDLLAKQITHLNIDIKNPPELCLKTISKIFVLILSLCKKLIKKLPRLKCLSFTVRNIVFEYDELLVSLFCRMINLEELKLYLLVGRFNSSYIDGIQLYDQFLIYMTQLKKFTFNIKSMVYNSDVSVELPSNEDIQHSFIGRGYQKVTSYLT
ncbi:unnamed protein product [Rotaria sordida]|uniref:Uncharacterized protein n=1 Tax=Rotaria sordida TaxID=392033 RepID=A0A813YGX4_9BILA|nr:unnamed protein product [Rotaria sordida]